MVTRGAQGRDWNGAREDLVGGGAGKFLILDLDADYMDVFSLWKLIKLSLMIITLFYICILHFN